MNNNNTIYRSDSRDYLILNSKQIPLPDKTYATERIAYYQSEVHKLSCSLHATITVVSNHTGYIFSLKDRKDILNLAIERGFDVNMGWYMNKAVKCVVDYCNDKLGMDLVYYRIPYTMFEEATKKGLGVISGYYQKVGMGGDRRDGVIGDDNIDYSNKSVQYGHLVSFWNYAKRGNQKEDFNGKIIGDSSFGYIDNYFPKHKNNETFVDNLTDLVKQKLIFKNGYIIVPKNNTNLKLNLYNMDKNTQQAIQEAFTVMTMDEMRARATEWSALEDFETGLEFMKKPKTFMDLRNTIVFGRISKKKI